MRISFVPTIAAICITGGVASAATPAAMLGVSAVVVERCAVVPTESRVADVRCDRGRPHRITRQIIVDPADKIVRGMRTTVIY